MSRDSRLYLEDILEAATRVRTYLGGASRQTLDSDLRTRDAVLHNLEVIGEAVKKLPDRVRPRAGSGLLVRVRPGHNAVLDEARRFP